MKILSYFPEVELYWLMNGKGSFPSKEKKEEKIKIAPIIENTKIRASENSDKEIERIVIFYTDGSFQNFENS